MRTGPPSRRSNRERACGPVRGGGARVANPDMTSTDHVTAGLPPAGMNRLQSLQRAGVSIWLDTLSRERLDMDGVPDASQMRCPLHGTGR